LHEKRDTCSDLSELKKIHVEANNFLGQNERKKRGGGGGGCAGPRGLKKSLFRQWNCEKIREIFKGLFGRAWSE